jgi:hypothetical protein
VLRLFRAKRDHGIHFRGAFGGDEARHDSREERDQRRLENPVELAGLRIGQWIEEHATYHGEHRAIGADPGGERDDGNRGESDVLREISKRIAKIVKESDGHTVLILRVGQKVTLYWQTNRGGNMNKRVILAGVLGGVAMFVWTSIAHMLLPLGEAGIKQIDKEEALLGAMQSTLNAPGFYMFPNMPPGNDQAQYQQKIANGPSGLLIYFPRRDFSFGKLLGFEFITELIEALIATYLLSLSSASRFGGRLGFYALIGIIAAIATNISYWNWYGFPIAYTASYIFTIWMGYVCAGLVAAAMKIGGSARSSR